MSLSSHILELQRKHQSLEDAVTDAQRAPSVDDLRVVELKKQKLKIKEEISRLQTA